MALGVRGLRQGRDAQRRSGCTKLSQAQTVRSKRSSVTIASSIPNLMRLGRYS